MAESIMSIVSCKIDQKTCKYNTLYNSRKNNFWGSFWWIDKQEVNGNIWRRSFVF